MKPFFKILLVVAVVLLAFKLLPVLLVPVILGIVLTLIVGSVLAAGVAALTFAGLSTFGALAAVTLVTAAVLSPIWMPVLAVIGLVSLCRRRPAVPVAA